MPFRVNRTIKPPHFNFKPHFNQRRWVNSASISRRASTIESFQWFNKALCSRQHWWWFLMMMMEWEVKVLESDVASVFQTPSQVSHTGGKISIITVRVRNMTGRDYFWFVCLSEGTCIPAHWSPVSGPRSWGGESYLWSLGPRSFPWSCPVGREEAEGTPDTS